MVSKIFFPRLVIPASAVATSAVDFLISAVLLAGVMGLYGFAPDARVLWLPCFLGIAMAAAFGAGLWLAALNVKYRDFRVIVPFLMQFGLLVSPVGFPSGVVPEQWRFWYNLNPMVGVIDGFRWALLRGDAGVDVAGLCLSLGVTGLLLFGGLWYFRRTERFFADII
jgi:lipopolysaccharide transport system permease protein